MGRAVGLGLAASLAASLAAQAQSAYKLTLLKASNNLRAVPMLIDTSNNVLGTAPYYQGLGSVTRGRDGVRLLGTFGMVFEQSPARWPAGTAASVAPKRVGSAFNEPSQISPDGSKYTLFGQVYDATNGQLLSSRLTTSLDWKLGGQVVQTNLGAGLKLLANDGSLMMSYDRDTGAGVWRHGLGVWPMSSDNGVSLVEGDEQVHAYAWAPPALIVGDAVDAASGQRRPALWRQGQRQWLTWAPGEVVAPHAVNAAGQVLLCVKPTVAPRVGGVEIRGAHPAVEAQGQRQDIAPLQAGDAITAFAMNAQGVVVGQSGPVEPLNQTEDSTRRAHPGCADTTSATARAFIWHSGVTTDLTTWVGSHGVSLAAGTVVANAIDINDQGSLLVRLRAADGTLSYARLTAQP